MNISTIVKSFLVRILIVVGLGSVGLLGCDTTPPAFLETSEISNTAYEAGPYEARSVLMEESGLESVRLFYEVAGLTRQVQMSRSLAIDDEVRPRYTGEIPGQPLDTIVNWAIEACDTRNNCATDPAAYPLHFYSFRVGRIPSNPVLTSLVPDVGPASGGTRIEIEGVDMRRGVRVTFAESGVEDGYAQESLHVEWIRTDSIVAISPAWRLITEAEVVDVSIENPDGARAFLPGAYTYIPSPVAESVDPTSGPTSGGTDLVIEGNNFFEGAEVWIDGLRCRSLVRISEEELNCTTPPGGAGFVDIVVRVEDRGESVLSNAFEYVAPPVVDAVTPDRGPNLGGTEIEIIGSNFDENVSVLVGNQPCDDIEVVSDTRIICTSPVADPGIVDVTVINEDGQSDVFLGGFNFLGPPVIVQVIPQVGPVAGGVEARIIGAGFSSSMQVLFGDSEAEVLDVIDDLEIRVTLPPTSVQLVPAPDSGMALVDITVINLDPEDNRQDTLADGFAYLWPPEIFNISPNSGPQEGDTFVTILGRFFREMEGGAFEVFFGDVLAEDVVILSSTGITAKTPPGPPGFVDVTVQNFVDSSGVLADGFLYLAPPEVDDVLPGSGPTFGGETVTIEGNFFQAGAIVFFGDAVCTNVTFISVTTLQCTTPPGAPGFVDVRVVNPDSQEGVGEGLYEYLTLTLLPDFGLEAGFTRVRILAGGIQAGAAVRFGNVLATDCERISSTEIICESPPHALGQVDVSFINLDGTGDTTIDGKGFTYRSFQDRTAGRLPHFELNSNDVEVADLDGDGDLDVAVANGFSGGGPEEDAVYRNNGQGEFSRIGLPGLEISNTVYTGNLNDDAEPDLIISVSGFGQGGALLLENQGSLDFEQRATPGDINGAFDAQLIDLIGDEKEDLLILAIGCSDGENSDCSDFSIGQDGFFERTGPGTFLDQSNLVPHDLQLVHDHKYVSPDLDLDGDRDIVLFVDNKNFSEPPFSVDNRHRILYNRINEGQGFEEDTGAFDGLVGDVFGVESGDLNGDGREDVIGASCLPPFGGSELIYIAQDSGELERDFAAIPNILFDCDVGVHAFDADMDGDLELLFLGHRELQFNAKIYVNKGDGTFVDSSVSLGAVSASIQNTMGTEASSGDINGDGTPDIVISANGLTGALSGGLILFLLE
jgi:hypothetical protein